MTSLLFGGHKLTRVTIADSNGLTFIELDATLSEGNTGAAQVTDHPVEKGSDITDHIRRQPEALELRGIVSNTPIMALSSVRAKPIIPGGDPASRAEEAYQFLVDIKDAGLLVDVSTTLRDYLGFAIVSVSVARDRATRNIVDLSLSLREIQVAVSETVSAPATADTTRKGKSNKGKRPKKDAPPPAAAKSSSVLFKFLGG